MTSSNQPNRIATLAWTFAALALVTTPATTRADDHDDDNEQDDDDHEVKVAFTQAPAAVQETVKRNVNGAPPAQLEKETENGVVVYEAEYKVGNLEHSLSVAATGELLELEKEISIDQLPAAVRGAVERAHPGATLREAEAIHAKGAAAVTLYEVEVKVGGKKKEVKVKPSGEIVN